ncbi:MAG: ATP-binding cassette domain-containing protein [Gemmatimonadota bacterium]|jgi:ABC-type lipopolysaccharide export system ATPase subunit
MDPLFVAESMGVSFVGRAVLKSASVWAYPGKVTVLLGRNGSGKTTLFKAALGLVSREFGTVRLHGQSHLKPKLHQLAGEGLFYLPDRGLLSRRRTLGKHLSLIRQRFPQDYSEGLPEGLDADPLMQKSVWEMSGGEERRAEVALAWARQPSCLLADEPLAGISPKDQEIVGSILRALADNGCAVVLTGHDVRPLMAIADNIVWMVAGTTHGIGTPAEARVHEQFRREYLGPGY